MADFTAVILAGGRSSRMGREKAALEIGGEPLLRRVVTRLRQATPTILIVGPTSLAALVSDVSDAPIVPDDVPDAGPLSGLATALRHITTPRAFVVACDMPFVSPPLVGWMARLAEESPATQVVVLHTRQGAEPLHAIYDRSCLPIAQSLLAQGERSLRVLLKHTEVRAVSVQEAEPYDSRGLSAFNANAPEEWRRALALAASSDV